MRKCTCLDPNLAGGNTADGKDWIGCPVHDEISEMLEPRSWPERGYAEFGSLYERTGLAYNRESYFR